VSLDITSNLSSLINFKKVKSLNYRDEGSENISFDLTLLSSFFESKISSEREADSVVSFISESELEELCGVDVQGKALSCPNVPFFDSYEMGLQGGIVSKNNAIYIGGYCAKKIIKKFNCNYCKALLCENIDEKNESHILCYEKTYNQIAFKNVISLNVGIVYIYMSDNFVKTVNETFDLQGNNLACRIGSAFSPNRIN
jgi:hypothetical protein